MGHDDHGDVHPEERKYSAEERALREEKAQKIQGVARTRTARVEVNKKKALKKARSMMPSIDSHGHEMPSTIKYFTSAPLVHVHHHEETFFELFYDLIIVVVLMKLSYLKYDFSAHGFFTVVAMFGNFWSVWSLLNVYITMVHQEDAVHRLFYALHTMMAFIMCIATEHPNYPFFEFHYQAFFFVMSGIISRFFIFFMWLYYMQTDKKMRENPDFKDYLPKYTREEVLAQVKQHAGSIFVAMVIFSITCIMEYDGDPRDSTDRRRLASSYSSYSAYADEPCNHNMRRLASSYSSYSSYSSSGDDDDCDEKGDHAGTIFLWILACVVETVCNNYTCIFDKLPFSGEYCGERMQAWLMLCFGESVIGLLITPVYWDVNSIKSLLASFVMVFCLVTVYFDVTDADKFLHLFILRHEKWKAFAYMCGQWPFSMGVFFIGVALKTLNYIEIAIHGYEVASGCSHTSEHLRRRLGEDLDHPLMSSVADGPHGRRLAASGPSFTLDQYDDLLFKSFVLLCFASVAVQVCSVLTAYAMPTDQEMFKVHMSRIGSVVIVLLAIIIPFCLQGIKTDCLEDYFDNRRRLASSYSSYSSFSADEYKDDPGVPAGLTVVEGLIVTAIIVMISFLVSIFSIDVEREHTYKELEDAAHHGRPAELNKHKKSLAERGGTAFVAGAFGVKIAPSPAAPAATKTPLETGGTAP